MRHPFPGSLASATLTTMETRARIPEALPTTCPDCGYIQEPHDRHCAYCGRPVAGWAEAEATIPADTVPPLPEPASGAEPRTAAQPRGRGRGVAAGAAAVAALKGGKILVGASKSGALLKIMPVLLKTGGSMALSLGFYAPMFGLWFAVGLLGLLLVHEMGHALVLRAMGVPFSAPLFIPFMGAVIGMKELPRDAAKEAATAFGGPVLGTIGAAVCLAIYKATGHHLMLGLAAWGFFLNLFNLIPFTPMDGGRIIGAVSPKIWLVVLPALLALALLRGSPLLVLVALVGIPRAIAGWRTPPELQDYFRVPPRVRILCLVGYVALAMALAALSFYCVALAYAEVHPHVGGWEA